MSQTAVRNSHISSFGSLSGSSQVVWNFPIDISFKATNIYGWPRIALSVYGIDAFGRDIVKGYGSALVPLVSGTHRIEVDMFTPLANSLVNQVFSWIRGAPPEVRTQIDSALTTF